MRSPRLTAVLKWTGLTLCVLIFAAWFASRWYRPSVAYRRGDTYCTGDISFGQVALWYAAGYTEGRTDPPSTLWILTEGWSLRCDTRSPPAAHWSWGIRASWDSPEPLYIRVPLYISFLAMLFPTAFLFYRDRRRLRWAREGRCLKCAYDLTALAAGSPCPECGKPPPP